MKNTVFVLANGTSSSQPRRTSANQQHGSFTGCPYQSPSITLSLDRIHSVGPVLRGRCLPAAARRVPVKNTEWLACRWGDLLRKSRDVCLYKWQSSLMDCLKRQVVGIRQCWNYDLTCVFFLFFSMHHFQHFPCLLLFIFHYLCNNFKCMLIAYLYNFTSTK